MTVRLGQALPALGLAYVLFQNLVFQSAHAQLIEPEAPETRPETRQETSPVARQVNWQIASDQGDYDQAVTLARSVDEPIAAQNSTSLATLISAASAKNLATNPQWLAFVHYKPTFRNHWRSQVDSPQFFMSDTGKNSPEAELNATLAAFYSSKAKPPLRLTAYCRFVARRHWLAEQLPEFVNFVPEQDCPEFDRYVDYLDAETLTLVFPSTHPNSPSSAFGHTLLRVDKKDQRPESRLLNMSINFAAEVPPDVSGAAYAIKGLGGGFRGRFTLLPYHLKLREYGQIENRDTWEYPLSLDKTKVDLVLRHTYEMLISHYDYYFFSENCSYHLLSLLDVAFPDKPLTDNFPLWTIPVDTIRMLENRGLASDPRFVPSAISTLRARRSQLPPADAALTLQALDNGLAAIQESLQQLPPARQAGILDLLSDYERYKRLESDSSARGSNDKERAILSLRSKLRVKSEPVEVEQPAASPESGHGTSRIAVEYHYNEDQANTVELSYRGAYHDFRDPSKGYNDKAAIEIGLFGVAYDTEEEEAYLSRVTLISIESIEPRGAFFKPLSWRTNIKWRRPGLDERHEFTFNAGAGVAYQTQPRHPVFFLFGVGDLVDAPRFDQRRQLRLGASAGAQWEPINRIRMGIDLDYRQQVGGSFHESEAELWLGLAIGDQLSLNINAASVNESGQSTTSNAGFGIRTYF